MKEDIKKKKHKHNIIFLSVVVILGLCNFIAREQGYIPLSTSIGSIFSAISTDIAYLVTYLIGFIFDLIAIWIILLILEIKWYKKSSYTSKCSICDKEKKVTRIDEHDICEVCGKRVS